MKNPLKTPNVFLLIATLLFLGCSEEKTGTSIDLKQDSPLSVFELFTDITAIQLETTPESRMVDIKKIEYYDGHYYILDERAQGIFCFDETGAFVFKISAQGKGPGEYHYITDLFIDKNNQQLVVLDPVVQRVHFYDLKGAFLDSRFIETGSVYGLNRVYTLPDSVLFLVSITYERFIFYSLLEDRIIYKDFTFDVPSTLHAFSPRNNVYYLEDRVFALLPLSRDVVEIKGMDLIPHYTWCFGEDNNSDRQIQRLLAEIRVKAEQYQNIQTASQAVGKDKILSHHILNTFETPRFRIALVEYNNDFKHVVIDKETGQTNVFAFLKEQIRLPMDFPHQDRVIAPFKPEFSEWQKEIIKRDGLEEYFSRPMDTYSRELLSDNDKRIIDKHDPLHDNPYLVVYKFKD